MAFKPTDFRLGGSFVQDLSGFQSATDQIGSFFTAKAGQESTLRGLQEGSAAVNPSDPALPDRRGDFKASDRAFNEASLKAYQAAVQNDVLESISRISSENADDPESFKNALEAYSTATLSSVDESIRPIIAAEIDKFGTLASIDIDKRFRSRLADETKQTLDANINLSAEQMKKAIRSGDDQLVMDLRLQIADMLTSPSYSLAEAAEITRNVTEAAFMENETAGVLNLIQAGDRLEAFGEVARLRGLEPPSGISIEEWNKHLNGVVSEVSAVVKARKDAREEVAASVEADRALQLSDVMSNIANTTREELKALFEEGIIPTKEKLISLDQMRQKAAEVDVELLKVARRIVGDGPIEVLSSSAVNQFYADNVSGLSEAQKVDYVDRVKMVPKVMSAEIDTLLLSGDTNNAISALSMIDQIDEIPGLDQPFSNNQRAYADWLVKLSVNMSPPEAVKKAQELTDPRNANRVSLRESEFKELQKGFNPVDLSVDGVIERGFFDINVDPSAINLGDMQKEYQDQVESLFISGMDINSAKDKAGSIVQRNWKDQDFLGRHEAFKYPLIDYYDVEGSIKYAERQLMKDVSDNLLFEKPPTKDEVFLYSDEQTAKEASTGFPSYLVYILQDGLITSTGQRFMPDKQAGVDARDRRLKAVREDSAVEAAKVQSDKERYLKLAIRRFDANP